MVSACLYPLVPLHSRWACSCTHQEYDDAPSNTNTQKEHVERPATPMLRTWPIKRCHQLASPAALSSATVNTFGASHGVALQPFVLIQFVRRVEALAHEQKCSQHLLELYSTCRHQTQKRKPLLAKQSSFLSSRSLRDLGSLSSKEMGGDRTAFGALLLPLP